VTFNLEETNLKILLFSDTHGQIEKAIDIYKKLKDIDLVVHLGDFASDAKSMEKQLGIKILSVKGNMDGSFSPNGHQVLSTPIGKILITHGHMQSAKKSPQNLLYKAEELGCKAVFYGHTHIPIFLHERGIYLLNPGSLTLPLGGRQGSYAVVTITESSLDASILYVANDEIVGNRSPKEPKLTRNKGKGNSIIRDLLNNSDRF
jgi:putative phosphoesterase